MTLRNPTQPKPIPLPDPIPRSQAVPATDGDTQLWQEPVGERPFQPRVELRSGHRHRQPAAELHPELPHQRIALISTVSNRS